MTLVAFLLLSAFAEPSATSEAAAPAEKPKGERMICKRIEATESRMASKRICKTPQQWKDAQWSETDTNDLKRDVRLRKD